MLKGFGNFFKGLVKGPEGVDGAADAASGTSSFGDKLNGFTNSAIGKGLSSAGNFMQTALPQVKQTPLNSKQQAGVDAMGAGFKAAENIPGVGQIIKIGNMANKLMPDFLAGGNKADQFINKIPGMKVLNFSVGKSDNFGLDQSVQQSGYAGTASQIKNTKDNDAGINQGAISSIFGAKKNANKRVAEAKRKQNRVSNVLDNSQLALDAQAGMAQDITTSNQLKHQGGFGNIAVGKQGMEIHKKWAQSILNSKPQFLKEGGTINKTIIPGGALHAHKNHLDKHDNGLSDAVTHKGVPVVTFEDGGEIEQHAEIERGEIIFSLEISKKIIELRDDGSEEAMIEAGKLIAKEIAENTIDKSGEYEINNKE